MLEIKNDWIKALFRRAKRSTISKDPYITLVNFEQSVAEYVNIENLSKEERVEAHRLMAAVNKAEIQILEKRDGVDLDGDGKIGNGR